MSIARRMILLACVGICLALIAAASASAAGFGQIGEPWGVAGSGEGQINPPSLFGVDQVDGSVYTGDVSADKNSYRIQKFSAAGKFEAAVSVPRWFEGKAAEEKLTTLNGVAVDHSRGRFYLLLSCKVGTGSSACKKIGSLFGAIQVLAFKTAPTGKALIPDGSFNLKVGAEEMYGAKTIAVDPATGNLLLFGEDAEHHRLIQRYSASGASLGQFVDSGNVLNDPAHPRGTAESIAVGPDGTVYALTGDEESNGEGGRVLTQAWKLPANLSKIEAVPGFSGSVEAEKWSGRAVQPAGGTTPRGAQLAISPDGSTLFWKETASGEAANGQFVVRGYSLTTHATKVLYGEGAGGRCQILSESAALATTAGEKLIVFDQTKGAGEAEGAPRVVTFGPGGTGCVAGASARFTINGLETQAESGPVTVSVTKGEAVAFDPTSSEILGEVEKVEWEWSDGSAKTVGTGLAAVSHTFTKTTTVGKPLEVKLTVKIKGNPTPATASGLVEVEAPVPVPPQAFLEIVSPASFSILPGTTVTFSGAMSWDPTTGSSKMKSYQWSFGDGSAEVKTTTPTVTHQFTSPSGLTLQRLVKLTVENQAGTKASDTRQITVIGSSGAELLPDLGNVVAAPAETAASNAPSKNAVRAAALAKKRKAAIAKCKKSKQGKARRRCLAHARTIGKSKKRADRGTS